MNRYSTRGRRHPRVSGIPGGFTGKFVVFPKGWRLEGQVAEVGQVLDRRGDINYYSVDSVATSNGSTVVAEDVLSDFLHAPAIRW